MTKKVGSTPKPVSTTSAKKATAKKTKPARAKAFGKAKQTAAKQAFPRTTWQDTNKLDQAIGKSQTATSGHPRIIHAQSHATQGAHHKPPIQMKYGGPRPPNKPPIQARYGAPTPNKPPIQMKYGGPRPPNKPPIQMKYGGPRPPNKPPIQMKYGAPRPNPEHKKV